MFSLVITIVSIALVVALVAATLYHGGDSIDKGSAEANLAGLVNQATQIQAAAVLYSAENSSAAPDLSTLVSKNYLKAQINNGNEAWTSAGGFALTTAADLATCTAFNAKYGVVGVPSCTGAIPAGPHCCQ